MLLANIPRKSVMLLTMEHIIYIIDKIKIFSLCFKLVRNVAKKLFSKEKTYKSYRKKCSTRLKIPKIGIDYSREFEEEYTNWTVFVLKKVNTIRFSQFSYEFQLNQEGYLPDPNCCGSWHCQKISTMTISKSRLNTLLCLHRTPINVVVSHGS